MPQEVTTAATSRYVFWTFAVLRVVGIFACQFLVVGCLWIMVCRALQFLCFCHARQSALSLGSDWKKELGPQEFLPPAAKYRDWALPCAMEMYYAHSKCLARFFGWRLGHGPGELGAGVRFAGWALDAGIGCCVGSLKLEQVGTQKRLACRMQVRPFVRRGRVTLRD